MNANSLAAKTSTNLTQSVAWARQLEGRPSAFIGVHRRLQKLQTAYASILKTFQTVLDRTDVRHARRQASRT